MKTIDQTRTGQTFPNVSLKHLFSFLLFLAIFDVAKSQANYFCGTQGSGGSQTYNSSASSTLCTQILEDCVPRSNDRVIEVNVNFWVLAPSTNSNSGVWTYSNSTYGNHITTAADASTCINNANALFANIPSPNLPMNGVTNISDAKIKLKLKSFNYILNTSAYEDPNGSSLGAYNQAWIDPNAINVFLGCESYTYVVTNTLTTPTSTSVGFYSATWGPIYVHGILQPYPNNVIVFNPCLDQIHPWGNFYWDNISNYGGVLAHEVGHLSGLDHTTYDAGPPVWDDITFISPTFGCCVKAEVNDAVKDDGTYKTCANGGSNNLMSQNTACGNVYLSPHQAAVMYFNYRTVLKGLLSSSGYTAAVTVNNAFDYSVTTNETWTTDRYFKGNITVKTNKNLTIKCGLAMTKGAKIIVEPGAQLIIDGGTITNISGQLWDGIYVQGNPNQPQLITNPNNTGSLLYNGIVRIKNNSTIKYATVGVRNYLTTTANTGGVIFAQNSNFIDNVRDVYMSVPASGAQPSASWFYNCSFKTLGVIPPNSMPLHHVELRNITGVKFQACNFLSGASPNTGGNGIFSVDAIYTVDNNNNPGSSVFENLTYGIYANNINPLRTPVISNTIFKDNWYGAYFMNVNYLAFQTNTLMYVTRSGASQVYLNNCKYYKIKNNLFTSSTNYAPNGEGVSAYKSKTGAHEIFRNTFSNMNVGINCMDDNGNPSNSTDGLKMNCNDFHITPNNYDVALTYASGLALPLVNKTQGQVLGTPAATLLVRNIYGANCGNQNKWHIYSGSTAIIDHGSNTNTLTAVTQPTATGCKSIYLNVVDKNIPLNYSTHCPANPPSSGGTSTLSSARLIAMNEYISGLQVQRDAAIAVGEIPDDYELQSTVASKLNLFLSDSALTSPQEVIDILEQNQGYMEDADIQTVFGYMHAGQFSAALNKTNELGPNRTDWKDLLTQVIAFQQDTVNGMDSISQGYIDFFNTYATSQNKDGKALTQALLFAASVSQYDEPHALPEETYSGRMANQQSDATGVESNETDSRISVFPNPSSTGLNIQYTSMEEGNVKIELSDLLGKVIYTNFSNNKASNCYISMSDLKAGMYLLNVTKDKEMIYTTKIIKED